MSLIRRAGQTIYQGPHVGSRGSLSEIAGRGTESYGEEDEQYLGLVKQAMFGGGEEEDLDILEYIQNIYGNYNSKAGNFNEKFFRPAY